jgi:hypothetical protein
MIVTGQTLLLRTGTALVPIVWTLRNFRPHDNDSESVIAAVSYSQHSSRRQSSRPCAAHSQAHFSRNASNSADRPPFRQNLAQWRCKPSGIDGDEHWPDADGLLVGCHTRSASG